jgi:hypothetical protein
MVVTPTAGGWVVVGKVGWRGDRNEMGIQGCEDENRIKMKINK